MRNEYVIHIKDYLDCSPRNKIVFYCGEIPDIQKLNLGLSLSKSLLRIKDANNLVMHFSNSLENVMRGAMFLHPKLGNTIIIYNPGILFETELKQDFTTFLANFSQNNLLIVEWLGEVIDDTLYFLSREHGVKIDIRHLSHIVIKPREN